MTELANNGVAVFFVFLVACLQGIRYQHVDSHPRQAERLALAVEIMQNLGLTWFPLYSIGSWAWEKLKAFLRF